MQGEGKLGTSYRHKEHGEEVNHGLHVETPLGRDADGGEEDQGAEGGQEELGHQRTHGCLVGRRLPGTDRVCVSRAGMVEKAAVGRVL